MRKTLVSALALSGLFLLPICPIGAATITEDFSSNPVTRQWAGSGNANLFAWNSANQNLEVTWDSSQTNSFFYFPLPVTLTAADDFSLAFDLRLNDAVAGIHLPKTNLFQLSAGLFNMPQALSSTFGRISGSGSPNVMDFSFFLDPTEFFTSMTAVMIDWTGTNWSTGGYAPFGLTTGDLFRITMTYKAADRKLRTEITKDGNAYGSLTTALDSNFLGFELTHFAIPSYSDEGQDPMWAGSILAHGTVDNIQLVIPDPVGKLQGQSVAGNWVVQFASRTNHTYTLERSVNLETWSTASAPLAGTGAVLTLQETNAPAEKAFYRVFVAR